MDEEFSAEKNGASKQIFFFLNKIFLISPKMERAKERQFFFFKLISRKNGASKEDNFFFAVAR